MPVRQDCRLAERCLNAGLALVYLLVALFAAAPPSLGRNPSLAARPAVSPLSDGTMQRTHWAGLP